MKIQAFLTVNNVKEQTASLVADTLPANRSVQNVQYLKKGMDAEISFSYPVSERVLSAVIDFLTSLDLHIESIFLHLPAEISGLRDIYDLKDKGSEMKEALLKINGILNANVSSTGSIKLQTNPQENQEEIVVNATNAIFQLMNKFK